MLVPSSVHVRPYLGIFGEDYLVDKYLFDELKFETSNYRYNLGVFPCHIDNLLLLGWDSI